jgi:hypothetical protein
MTLSSFDRTYSRKTAPFITTSTSYVREGYLKKILSKEKTNMPPATPISQIKTKKSSERSTTHLPSILIDNPQTPPRIKQHAHKSRLLPRQQILRRTPPPLRRIATPSTPARNSALCVRPAGCFAARHAIAPALGTRLASALLRRQQAHYSRNFLAAGLALRHLDVLFVEAELFTVDESAEEEVAD